MGSNAPDREVMAFYKFHPLNDPEASVARLRACGEQGGIKGTILVAHEGVNGTVVGTPQALGVLQEQLIEEVGELPCKFSMLDEHNPGFYRFKVRTKPEIVSFGVPDLDVTQTGEHVDAERWNELLADPDVTVIDTRNTYEIDIGTFAGAVDPRTTNFREFPQWVADNLDVQDGADKPVAMFCTGGIRCEKASAYLKQIGFENVYQLDGGVLRYLETAPTEDNRWSGECFVFDQRVSVTKDLTEGSYTQCFACRHPLSEDERAAPEFEHGVSCPHCYETVDDARRASLTERQRQMALAESRGEQHIGAAQNAAHTDSQTEPRSKSVGGDD